MDLMNKTTMLMPFNCSVDTSYRFTYYQMSYSLIFSFGLASNVTALRRLWLIPRNLTSTTVYMANFCCGFAVVHPLRQHLRRLRLAQTLSAGIWLLVLALSLSLPFLLSAASLHHQPCLLDPTSQRHRIFILVALGLVQTAFLLPALLLFFCYCSVLRALSRLVHRRKVRHQRTLTVIYWVPGVFLLCFAPYHVNLLGYTLAHMGVLPSCSLVKVTTTLHPIVLSVASTNCCLNPLIYYFSRSLVHKEVVGN